MPKVSYLITNPNHIAENNAFDDVLYWQRKLDTGVTQKIRDYYRGKIFVAEQLLQKAKLKNVVKPAK